jgi:hypothetical protein
MEKPPLQRIFFPAKISFEKIQKKNLAGKNLLCKGTRSIKNLLTFCDPDDQRLHIYSKRASSQNFVYQILSSDKL